MRFGVLLAGLLMAAPANAVTYIAQMTGTITQQFDTSFNDPLMAVGETVTMWARFDSASVYDEDLGPNGLQPVAHIFTGDLGDDSFRVSTANFTWTQNDNRLLPGYPWLSFADGKVTGLYGSLMPAETNEKGELALGGKYAGVGSGNNVDLNNYVSPGFAITFDFAGSSVTAVPEPSSWAMMIAGMGLIGASLRKRRSIATV